MAALAAVQGRKIEEEEELLKAILGWERGVWEKEIEDIPKLEGPKRDLLFDCFSSAVAGFTLIDGASTHAHAKEALLRFCTDLNEDRPELPNQLLKLLRRLYPGLERFLDGLQPDLLGEQLVILELTKEPALLERVLEESSPELHREVLTVLVRIAGRARGWRPSERATHWLRTSLKGNIEGLAVIAVEIARDEVARNAISPVLAEILESEGSLDLCRQLLSILEQQPEDSLSVFEELQDVLARRVARTVTRPADAVVWYRHRITEVEDQSNLPADEFQERKEETLALVSNVEHLRALAAIDESQNFNRLAQSLESLMQLLMSLGLYQEALEVGEERVELYRSLVHERI